jgi:hypothetical protein
MMGKNWDTCTAIVIMSMTLPYLMDILCMAFQGTIALNPSVMWDDATRKKGLL